MSSGGDENFEKLVVAMNMMMPFLQGMGQNGQYYGVFYELVRDMADNFGKKLEIVSPHPTSAITGLQTRQYDIISFMPSTPERQKVVDFSILCGRMSINFIVKKDFPFVANFEQLNDSKVRIGIVKGSCPESLVFEKFPHANIVIFSDFDSLILEVVQGKSDVAFLPTVMAHEVAKKYPGQVQAYYQSLMIRDVFLVVRKTEDKKFLNTINAFLTDYIESGKLRFLGDKYLGDLKAEFAKQGLSWNFVF